MINIAFDDWWQGFNLRENFITRLLDGNMEYFITDNPDKADFLFCSIEKINCFKYKCPRILFTGENYSPNFNFYDYAIGFDHMTFGDRYFRYPLYVACYDEACKKIESRNKIDEKAFDRDFCSFVVSNSSAEEYRVQLFDKLSEYKKVSSGGRYKNNIGLANGVDDKISFLSKYKFNIACENISHPGYCTEKIVEAFAAGTIPVYWGDPLVTDYFNPKAFINCNDYNDINSVIDVIKEIDNDKDRYLEMLSEPVLMNRKYEFEHMRESFKNWLLKVISQSKEKAYRRCFSGYSYRMEKEYLDKLRIDEEKKKKQGCKSKIRSLFGL